MNQFKLWIRFSPAGFQGNQGLCVCLCHQPAPLDCPELFLFQTSTFPARPGRGGVRLCCFDSLGPAAICAVFQQENPRARRCQWLILCVWESWAQAELGKWMWHSELLWLLSPLDLPGPNNFITRASRQSKCHSLHSVFTTLQIISS